MANVLDKELIQYFVRLNEPQKRSLLPMMKSFLKTSGPSEAGKQSIEEYNNELDDAIKRIDSGNFKTLEEFEAEMQTW